MSFEELITGMCREAGLNLAKGDGGFLNIVFTDEQKNQHPVFLHEIAGHGGLPLLEVYKTFLSPAENLSRHQLNFLLQSSTTFSAGTFAIVQTPNSSLVIYRFRIPLYQLDAHTLHKITDAVASCGNQLRNFYEETK